jgi:hypothetical protein
MLQGGFFDNLTNIRMTLIIAFILLLWIGSAALLMKARKIELLTHRRILQGYALFGICFSFTRIFFLLDNYYRNYLVPSSTTTGSNEWVILNFWDDVWIASAHAVTLASIVFIFRVVEHYMLNKKPIFTIIGLGALCYHLFVLVLIFINLVTFAIDPANYVSDSTKMALFSFQNAIQSYEGYVQTVAIIILGVAIIVLYLFIAKKTTGTLRKKAIVTFLGIIMLMLGLILDLNIFASITLITLLPPIFSMIAVLLVFISVG